jgi:hypothetical protein
MSFLLCIPATMHVIQPGPRLLETDVGSSAGAGNAYETEHRGVYSH